MASNRWRHMEFSIDPSHLTADELAYERAIRPLTQDIRGQGAMTELGMVAQMMTQERNDNTDPIGLNFENRTDEEIANDLATCLNQAGDLQTHVETQALLVRSHQEPTEVPAITSRLRHYELRLNRIPRDRLTLDQTVLCERASRTIALALTYVTGMVTINESGHAMLVNDTSASSGSTETNQTLPNSSSTLRSAVTQTNNADMQDAPLITLTTSAPTAQPASHFFQAPTTRDSQVAGTSQSVYTNAQIHTAPATQNQNSYPIDSERINRGIDYMQSDARAQFNGVTFNTEPNVVHRYVNTLNTDTQAPHDGIVPRANYHDPLAVYTQGNANTSQASHLNNAHHNTVHVSGTNNQFLPPSFQSQHAYQRNTYSQQRPNYYGSQTNNFAQTNPIVSNANTMQTQARIMSQQQRQVPNSQYRPNVQAPTGLHVRMPASNSMGTDNAYHPATTPYPQHYQDDPLNLNTIPQGSPNVQMNHTLTTNAMNPCQAQQYLGRMLSNRRYEGYPNENNKQCVALDEFIGLIRQYQTSTGTADRHVLDQVATYMTGKAFAWWSVNCYSVHSIADLEQRLRAHFERQATDGTSILIEFASRAQKKDEDLLDFIDEMRHRYLRCSTQVSEHKAVEIIVNNTNDTYNSILAARVYNSLEHLAAHAEYLMRGKARKSVTVNRFDRKQFTPYKSRVNATEECNEMSSEFDESEDVQSDKGEVDIDENGLSLIFAEAIKRGYVKPTNSSRTMNKFVNKKKEREPKVQSTCDTEVHPIVCTNCTKWGHTYQSCMEPKTIRCYGCGQEGVIRTNCDKCKSKNV